MALKTKYASKFDSCVFLGVYFAGLILYKNNAMYELR